MSQNNGSTSDASTEDNEFAVAVIAEDDFGENDEKSDRAKKVIDILSEAIERDGWESPDTVVYASDMAGFGRTVSTALKAYNNSMRKRGKEENMFNIKSFEARWNDTSTGEDSDVDMQKTIAQRDDGTDYWLEAATLRDSHIEMNSDALVVLGEDSTTQNLIKRFENKDKPVHEHHGIDEDVFDPV
jgi:hypothetical protein